MRVCKCVTDLRIVCVPSDKYLSVLSNNVEIKIDLIKAIFERNLNNLVNNNLMFKYLETVIKA